MKKLTSYFFLISLLMISSCAEETGGKTTAVPDPVRSPASTDDLLLDSAAYHDKVLGALVGSAIGDAMGASTEMWTGEAIRSEFGYITGLTLVERSASAEGTWQHNMDSGATTDDTRWKYLMVKYLTDLDEGGTAERFADYIVDYYQAEAKGLSDEAILEDTDLLDRKIQRIDWIKEWARVALAYRSGATEYAKAQNRFYGGEMSCAGMLYTPMFGLVTPSPEKAYEMAYAHGLFDIGYARDISSLVAAMTQMALHADSIAPVLRHAVLIDPNGYMDSRLIGRLSYTIVKDSRELLKAAKQLDLADTIAITVPQGYPGTRREWMEQLFVFGELEKRSQDIAFHAGEIWQILVTALYFGQGDFEKTMQFIVNYGRDNDTVAAVAGMILGAQLGYSKLPEDLRDQVVSVSREVMGINLEALAIEMVNRQFTINSSE